jgi:uncharacterized protein YjiS (DUF1127 family)
MIGMRPLAASFRCNPILRPLKSSRGRGYPYSTLAGADPAQRACLERDGVCAGQRGATKMSSTTIGARGLATGPRVPAGRAQATRANGVRRLIEWIRNERQIRRSIRELSALDDRLLADIGVPRGHIEYVSRYGRLPHLWGHSVRHWINRP